MSGLWTRGGRPGSERDVLALIDSLFESKTPHTPLGRGHDCGVLANLEGRLALSTDMFWQDSHFRTDYFTPGEVGAKALSVAVSDLAAAGAVPMGFSLDLLLPPWLGMEALEGALSGMAEKAREYGVILAGGDVAGGEQLGFSITVWGGPASPGAPFLQRAGAAPGDCIFLVGEAGLALVGLLELERLGRDAALQWPLACAAHLNPRPLLAEGQALARLGAELSGGKPGHCPCPTGLRLMDLSDGPARDLPRLVGSFGADIALDPAIIPAEVRIAARPLGQSPERLFMLGGEDYALLGSCAEAFWPLVRDAVPGTRRIGRVRRQPGIAVNGEPFTLGGFDHFASAESAGPGGSGKSGGAWEVRGPDGPDGSGGPAGSGRLGGAAGATASSGAFNDPGVAEAVKTLIKTGREAWEAGLMAGFNGNISCRVTLRPPFGEGEACLITRSGSAKSRLGPDDFALASLVNLDGPVSSDSPGGLSGAAHCAGPAASSELGMHLELYKACPGSAVILHTHPPHLLALSLRLPPEERLALPLPEAERYRKRLAFAPYHPPGSGELASAVALAAGRCEAVWMERHGLVAHGPDAASVISLTEELEQLAMVRLLSLGA